MTAHQTQIKEFMRKAGQDCPDKPVMPTLKVRKLRAHLIAEELGELACAFGLFPFSIIYHFFKGYFEKIFAGEWLILWKVYDAAIDLMVVTIGTAVACGMELELGWEETHRSNMSKFIDGHRRADGKWIKGPSYSPANLEPIIEGQKL